MEQLADDLRDNPLAPEPAPFRTDVEVGDMWSIRLVNGKTDVFRSPEDLLGFVHREFGVSYTGGMPGQPDMRTADPLNP